MKLERAKINISQAELADKVGVSRQTINSIEKGKFVPSTIIALKTAKIFTCQIEDVFELDEGD